MRRGLNIALVCVAVLAVYVASYLPMSVRGHYEPAVYGLMQGPDDTALMVPKGAFGYVWWPFSELTTESRPVVRAVLFSPLIAFDRRCWHTTKFEPPFQYRVMNYFDFETLKYRNIEPD